MARRFLRVAAELAVIRETHRTVLEWVSLADGKADAFSVQLSADDLAGLRTALATEPVAWRSARGDAEASGAPDRPVLSLRGPDGRERRVELDGTEARALRAGLGEFLPGR